MDTKRFFLIVNLIAGQGHCKAVFPRVRAELDRRGVEYDLHYTNEPLEAIDVARMGIEAGFTNIVAMGGDGTINEVANGLRNSEAVLSVIPAGTGNDFVRMMGIPSQPLQALDVLSSNHVRNVDIAVIDDDRCFVNGLGIGIDAQVARDVLQMKHLRGAVAYMTAAAKEVFGFQAFPVRLSSQQWVIEKDCLSLNISNGRYTGGGFKLAPKASMEDGLIDVAAVGDFPRIVRGVRLLQARGGQHLRFPQVDYHQVPEVEVSSTAKLIAHVDGEPYRLPRDRFTVHVLHRSLRVQVPS